MKICFISGPSRPYQCGISDYVRLLTDEFKLNGHKINLASVESTNGLSIILKDQPAYDLYSLQYAPYSFSSKGIIGKPLIDLGKTLHDRKVHVNFHEIWIGDYSNAPVKEKLIGWLQKIEIRMFLKITRPALLTCSNAAALDRLKRRGFPAKFLYLFGNIPYSANSKLTTKGQTLKVAFFGTPYADFPYDILGKFFSSLSNTSGKKLKIILIGRQREDAGADHLYSMCKKNKFIIERTGELSTNLISEKLQDCTVGVSTTPFDVIGKSGTTAAMLEHGLPVLAYDDGDTPQESLFIPDPFKDQIFLINKDSSLEKLIQYIEKPRKSFFDGVAHTANKMLELVS